LIQINRGTIGRKINTMDSFVVCAVTMSLVGESPKLARTSGNHRKIKLNGQCTVKTIAGMTGGLLTPTTFGEIAPARQVGH
jgi:hypothetical protein